MRSVLLYSALALAGVTAAAVLSVLHQRGFTHLLGIDTQASDNYDFTSGIGPMLLTAASMTTLLGGMFRHASCHVDGCWRLGRYHVAGGQFRVCRKHHPDDIIRTRQVTHRHVIRAHLEHQRRTP